MSAANSTHNGRRSFSAICSSLALTIAKAPPAHLFQASAPSFFNYAIVNPTTFFDKDAVSIGNALKHYLLANPTSNAPSLSPAATHLVAGYNAYRLGHSMPENILFISLIRIAASEYILARLRHYSSTTAAIPGTDIRPANADPSYVAT